MPTNKIVLREEAGLHSRIGYALPDEWNLLGGLIAEPLRIRDHHSLAFAHP